MLYDKQKHVEEVIKKIESIVGPIVSKEHFEERLRRAREYKTSPYYRDCAYIMTFESMEERKKQKHMTSEEEADFRIKCLEEQVADYDDNILKSEKFIDEEIRKREIGNIAKSLEK